MKTLFISAMLLSCISAQARYNCVGNELRQHGKMKGSANFTFDLQCLNSPVCIITNLTGMVMADGDPTNTDPEYAYHGYFKIKSMTSDPRYRPTKYKNARIFRKVNAYRTKGAEDGMWGDLIVAQSTRRSQSILLEAHYVFQAGDHMGGTIHMKCVQSQSAR